MGSEPNMDNSVIAYIDKTVVRIKGVDVRGLKPFELEKKLSEFIQRGIRVIGVTGESIEMDIYNIDPEAILKDESGIIKAISAVEGITATELTKIDSARKIVEVDVNSIPKGQQYGCQKERWNNIDK
jgi:translation elongation factor EF-1beta